MANLTLALLAWPSVSEAQSHSFVRIAETPTSAPFPIAGPPTINDAGQVAYGARTFGALITLYRGDLTGSPPITLYDGRNPSDPFDFFLTAPILNNAGEIAVQAGLKAGGANVFRGDGGVPVPIVDSQNLANLTGFAAFNPSINDAGVVAAGGQLQNNDSVLFRGDGGSTEFLYRAESGSPYDNFGPVAINNANQLAFTASLTAGGEALLRGDGLTTETLADTSGIIAAFTTPGLSFLNDGRVVFLAGLDDGRQAVLLADGIQVTVLADTAGPFSEFLAASISETGQLGMLAFLDGGGFGLFRGPNPDVDTIIKLGDDLFDSTVTALDFNERGVNDRGEYAFFYELANGQSGIAVAAVPEPTAATLSLVGVSAWVLTRLARRKRETQIGRRRIERGSELHRGVLVSGVQSEIAQPLCPSVAHALIEIGHRARDLES